MEAYCTTFSVSKNLKTQQPLFTYDYMQYYISTQRNTIQSLKEGDCVS